MTETTYCSEHERLEPFDVEYVETNIPPEAIRVRVRLECGNTKRIARPDEEAA